MYSSFHRSVPFTVHFRRLNSIFLFGVREKSSLYWVYIWYLKGKGRKRKKPTEHPRMCFCNMAASLRVMSNLVQALLAVGFWEVWSFLFWLYKLFLSSCWTHVVSHKGLTVTRSSPSQEQDDSFGGLQLWTWGLLIQVGLPTSAWDLHWSLCKFAWVRTQPFQSAFQNVPSNIPSVKKNNEL